MDTVEIDTSLGLVFAIADLLFKMNIEFNNIEMGQTSIGIHGIPNEVCN